MFDKRDTGTRETERETGEMGTHMGTCRQIGQTANSRRFREIVLFLLVAVLASLKVDQPPPPAPAPSMARRGLWFFPRAFSGTACGGAPDLFILARPPQKLKADLSPSRPGCWPGTTCCRYYYGRPPAQRLSKRPSGP